MPGSRSCGATRRSPTTEPQLHRAALIGVARDRQVRRLPCQGPSILRSSGEHRGDAAPIPHRDGNERFRAATCTATASGGDRDSRGGLQPADAARHAAERTPTSALIGSPSAHRRSRSPEPSRSRRARAHTATIAAHVASALPTFGRERVSRRCARDRRLGRRLGRQPRTALHHRRQGEREGARVRCQRPPARRQPGAARRGERRRLGARHRRASRSPTSGPRNGRHRPAASPPNSATTRTARTSSGSTTTMRSRCTACARHEPDRTALAAPGLGNAGGQPRSRTAASTCRPRSTTLS